MENACGRLLALAFCEDFCILCLWIMVFLRRLLVRTDFPAELLVARARSREVAEWRWCKQPILAQSFCLAFNRLRRNIHIQRTLHLRLVLG
jgi:hypothetical protein